MLQQVHNTLVATALRPSNQPAVASHLVTTGFRWAMAESSALSAFSRHSAVRALAAAPSSLAFRASATRIRDRLRSAASDRGMFANMAVRTPSDNTVHRFVIDAYLVAPLRWSGLFGQFGGIISQTWGAVAVAARRSRSSAHLELLDVRLRPRPILWKSTRLLSTQTGICQCPATQAALSWSRPRHSYSGAPLQLFGHSLDFSPAASSA